MRDRRHHPANTEYQELLPSVEQANGAGRLAFDTSEAEGGSQTVLHLGERMPDAEVSPFFHDIAAIGDEIEVRGPLGGHFLWPEPAIDPVLLIGGGSGLVPLMAMIRQRRALAQAVPTALLLSARTAEDVLFSEELHCIEISDPAFVLALAITREKPVRASDFARRIDGMMVQEILTRLQGKPTQVFVCGSNGFVNIATDSALLAGLDASIIKTERYGG